jgi:uncharacterized DUF497 family protein
MRPGVRFEWDPAKDVANRRRHGISFEEVEELFTSDVEYLEIFDDEHSQDEDRFIAIGPIAQGVILVVYTERHEGVVRIISARRATRAEARLFWKHVEGKDG